MPVLPALRVNPASRGALPPLPRVVPSACSAACTRDTPTRQKIGRIEYFPRSGFVQADNSVTKLAPVLRVGRDRPAEVDSFSADLLFHWRLLVVVS